MTRELYRIFAALFRYPDSFAAEQAQTGTALATPVEASTALADFAALAREIGTDRLQELYTAAFDLQALCAPYLGHQLCGEDPRRGRFLVALQAIYRQAGFVPGPELADHLAEVLRFVADAPASAEREALVRDGLQPALAKMCAAFDGGENPYGRLLGALRLCLETASACTGATTMEVAHV